MRGSEFSELKAFAAVAELGTFARASELLAVSPSALSQTIRRLEERLGVRLLNRTTRSVTQTEAGARLYSRLAPLFVELDAAIEQVNDFRAKPAGTVRICAPQMAILHIIQPMLADFQAAYPDIVLDLSSDDSVGDIFAHGFDAGIRLGKFIDQDMIAVALGPELRQVAVASPAYLQAHGAPATPEELVRHRCINWRRPGLASLYHWEFARDGERFDLAVKGSLIVNDCAVALQAAVDGLGITVWTEQWMQAELQSGRLQTLLDDWSPPSAGFYLYHPSRRQTPATLRAFIDFARARLVQA